MVSKLDVPSYQCSCVKKNLNSVDLKKWILLRQQQPALIYAVHSVIHPYDMVSPVGGATVRSF